MVKGIITISEPGVVVPEGQFRVNPSGHLADGIGLDRNGCFRRATAWYGVRVDLKVNINDLHCPPGKSR